MKNNLKIAAAYLAIFAGVLLVGWGTNWFGLVAGRPMAKYAEETRRQVFTESRIYQEGMAQNLDTLCREWRKTDDPGVAASIRQRAAGYAGPLPAHVETCLYQARGK